MQRAYITLLAAACLAPLRMMGAEGDTFTYNNLRFKVLSETEKTCEVSDNAGITGEVSIPAKALDDASTEYTVTAIGEKAFAASRNMTAISLPEGITTIRYGAFEHCSGLTDLVIPNSVTLIEQRGIYGCSGLTSLTIGNGLTEILPYVFSGCMSLPKIVIPESVVTIHHEAFNYCSGMRTLVLGKNVEQIGVMGFAGCGELRSLSIPGSMKKLEREAFSYCGSLKSVTLEAGEGVLEFDGNVFGERVYAEACAPIEKLSVDRDFTCLMSDISLYPFANIPSLSTVVFGNKATAVSPSAFYGDNFLMSVEFGQGIRNIGPNAFTGCGKLSSIDVPVVTPPVVAAPAFESYSLENAIVRVPRNHAEAYKSSSSWRDFRNIVGFDFDIPEAYTVVITPENAEVETGKTLRLTATLSPAAEGSSTVWKSSDTDVATVDADGNVTGIREGTVEITAEVSVAGLTAPISATAIVNVIPPVGVGSLTATPTGAIVVCRTDGSVVFRGDATALPLLPAGVYVVRSALGTSKIIMK